MPVIGSSHTMNDMAKGPLGNVEIHSSPTHKTAGGPAQIVNGPGLHAIKLGIEGCLGFAPAIDIATTTSSQHVRITGEPWPSLNNVQSHRWQGQTTSVALFPLLGRNVP